MNAVALVLSVLRIAWIGSLLLGRLGLIGLLALAIGTLIVTVLLS